MENDEPNDLGDADFSIDSNCSAVNKLILDYYKKFGRKRDIEQFFSLSTAQQDLSEPSGLFWKKMKEQNDSSDSGDKKTGSSTEVCRISIKCLMDDPHTSKIFKKSTDSDTESPPIICDDVTDKCLDSGDESNKSDGEHSHKSIDMALDTSLNRPHSPTSSITSQRKLEWDSLADVGYGNESDRKNSASSLSTLERLALHQQYSNNDTKPNSELGIPTAHSTPLDQTESKSKVKKDGNKKTSKFCKKDVDIMEVNIPNTSNNPNQPINVNLTKHISFNVEKDGVVKMDNMTKNISVCRDNSTSEGTRDNVDKEIQTTLPRNSEDNVALSTNHSSRPRFPILINLNTIRNRKKKRRRKVSRPRKRGTVNKENIPLDKSINQESDAESFEYMPGHMYNQNKLERKGSVLNVADNKSSLESSAGHTTESSKDFQYTFTKELEKSIDLLKLALQHRYKDTSLKKKLIKEVVQSLVQTNFKNNGNSNDFLFGSNQNNQIASSTSESNNIDCKKPKKSILRAEKFNSAEIATTSQSAPNLPTISTAINLEKPIKPVNLSSTDSDLSYKSKYLSEVFLANSSSEEIYKKYLLALKKENLYKNKLREQELVLRQKIKHQSEQICHSHIQEKSNLDDLIKDLAKNNYADGSGDASNAGLSSSNVENGLEQRNKSHAIFTLSGGNNDVKRNKKLKNRLESEINYSMVGGSSSQCQGCSAYRQEKVMVTDSSVQVNIGSQLITKTDKVEQNTPLSNEKICAESSQENLKYICLCTENPHEVPDNFLMYRCSRVPSKCIMVGSNKRTNICPDDKSDIIELAYNTNKFNSKDVVQEKKSTTSTQSSQTHFSLPKLIRSSCNKVICSSLKNKSSNKDDSEKNTVTRASSNRQKGSILTQTEISINPKISDPSMSDVKIVSDIDSNDGEIEKNEKCKYVQHSHPKSNIIDDSVSQHSTIEENAICGSENYKVDKIGSKLIGLQNLQPQSNFTIPIHGTNMTLKVSLDSKGSDEKKNKDIKPTYPHQPLCLDDIDTLKISENKNTLLLENIKEKQTQCVSVQTSNMTDHKSIEDNVQECYKEASDSNNPTTSAYNKYECVDIGYYNTYPKENAPKAPLIRSNTDTGKMECSSSSPPIDKKCTDTRKKSLNEPSLKSQAASYNSPKKIPESKIDTLQKYNNRYILKDTENLDKEIPESVQLRSNIETENNEFYNPQTAKGMKKEDLKCKPLEKQKLRSNFDSNKTEVFDRHKSMTNESGNSKEGTLKKTMIKPDIKNISDRHASMGEENENSKEGTLKRSITTSETDHADAALNKRDIDTQYDNYLTTQLRTKGTATEITDTSKSSNDTNETGIEKLIENSAKIPCSSSSNTDDSKSSTQDPLLDIIRDITKRYSKKEVNKSRRKKCYSEIITVLNYLLDTSGNSENESNKARSSSTSEDAIHANRSSNRPKTTDKQKKSLPKDIINYGYTHDLKDDDKTKKTFKDKSVQPSPRKSKQSKCCGESSDCPVSTDIHSTSTNSTACRTHKLKHHCEKHQCCNSHCKKCDISSSSSVYDTCKHRCYCRGHRSHKSRISEKAKKCVAYNLILQTSDSIASEEMDKQREERHLKNIVVKVPSRRRVENMQFKEITKKIESDLPRQPFATKTFCAGSLHQENDVSSTDNVMKNTATCTIRDYLEQNRPDFVERSAQRQSCLKLINKARASERATKREVLSAHVARDLADPSDADLRRLAESLGKDLRTRKLAPKFISEKEMKKHSEKIYKSLPEVQRKKDEIKKERIKKTNLLMANIFKKNLQKKTLQGAVNLSNYSAVIKI